MIARRVEYSHWIPTVDPAHLMFVDEFGLNLGMTRRYARAPRGERAYAHAPGPHLGNITLVFGLRLNGVVSPMLVPGAMTGARFAAYVRDNLATSLGPDDVVVWDNLKAHKTAKVAALVAATGARIEFVPPYSPDLTPVENCGAKVKTALRAAAARAYEKLVAAAADALHAVTPRDAQGFFTHAGFDPTAYAAAWAPPRL